MVIFINLVWFNQLLVEPDETDIISGSKIVIATTSKGTACRCCETILSTKEDSGCDDCKMWYHLECGIQKRLGVFTCPRCNTSSKLDAIEIEEIKEKRKVGRPKKKQKIN